MSGQPHQTLVFFALQGCHIRICVKNDVAGDALVRGQFGTNGINFAVFVGTTRLASLNTNNIMSKKIV